MTFHVVEPFELNGTYYVPYGAERPKEPVKATDSGEELKIDDSGSIELQPKDAKKLLADGSIVRGSLYVVQRPIEHDDVLYLPETWPLDGFAPTKNAQGKVTGYTARSFGHGQKVQVSTDGMIELVPVDAEQLLAIGAITKPTKKKK